MNMVYKVYNYSNSLTKNYIMKEALTLEIVLFQYQDRLSLITVEPR